MRRILPTLAAAATGVQVGAAIVATRFVVDQTGPASLAFMRYVIGVCCLAPVVLLAPRVRFARRDLVPIAILGIIQFGVLVAVLNYGLRFIPAGRAALIFASFPLQTMLIAAWLGRERMTLHKTAGVILTILGVGLAIGDKAWAPAQGTPWVGELAVLASAFCGALCSVLYRPYLARYPALPVSAFAMLASVGFLAILAAGEGFFAAWPAISAGGWGAVVFIGLSSGGGYFMWLWALRHNASPTRATAFMALSPLTAILLGAGLLGEAVSVPTLGGLVAVGLGLWLAHWRKE